MELLKSKLDKISNAMKSIEDVASSHIKTDDDYLQVCGAMLAVTRNMYVNALGVEGAARMFEEIANTFMIQEEMLNKIYYGDTKPTIH
tara:strand:- start:218 stop:481 length:264 start_codon:yes stop_codon:yes gene_type:complete